MTFATMRRRGACRTECPSALAELRLQGKQKEQAVSGCGCWLPGPFRMAER